MRGYEMRNGDSVQVYCLSQEKTIKLYSLINSSIA